MTTYLSRDNKYNIGILTGKASNIAVIDIDLPKDDKYKDGMKKWNELIKEYGKINTLTARTQSGGLHYIFKYNPIFGCGSTHIGGYTIDIRSDNNQILVYPSKYGDNEYKWINKTKIIDIPEWLSNFLVDNTDERNSNKCVNKIINRNTNKQHNKNNSGSLYIIEEKEIKQIRYMLNHLPERYYDSYDLWRNIGFALSSTSYDKLLPLFIEFSEKSSKYDYNSCINLWHSIKNNKNNNIRINSLIYWFQFYNKNDDTKFIFLHTKKYEPILKYKDDELLTVKYNKIKKLTDDPNVLLELLKYKIIFLKSATGTCKTQLYKEYLKKVYNNKILSIVSRKSIANKQKEDFKDIGIDATIYYEADYIESNMICQVDSICKLDSDLYIDAPLFLDEFNSICGYLMSRTLDGKRREVFEKFIDIILN